MALELLNNGSGLEEPLAGILKQAAPYQLLTLTLESVNGPLLTAGRELISTTSQERNIKALPALAEEPKNEKRFFFAMSKNNWEVISAFTIDKRPYFTTLTLDITQKAGTPVRSGLFKLADYFTVQCRNHLRSYIKGLAPPKKGETVPYYSFEKKILEAVTSFSDSIQCAVLLDEDGFIIHTEGGTGKGVDELGGALAKLFYQSNHALSRLDLTECNAITVADLEYTIRIGRLPGTSLALAVSAGGPYAAALAHFLHTAASESLISYAGDSGQLWGVAIAEIPAAARIRESWFVPPRLIPLGQFVGKRGGKSFHKATCHLLAKTDSMHLHWFMNKDEAVREGLRPCSACNP